MPEEYTITQDKYPSLLLIPVSNGNLRGLFRNRQFRDHNWNSFTEAAFYILANRSLKMIKRPKNLLISGVTILNTLRIAIREVFVITSGQVTSRYSKYTLRSRLS